MTSRENRSRAPSSMKPRCAASWLISSKTPPRLPWPRRISSIKRFCRHLARRGVISTDPTINLVTPKQDKKLPNHLTVDDTFRLLEAPDVSKPAGQRDRAILEVIYSAGLRVSEVVGLNWADVDESLGILRVRGKGRKRARRSDRQRRPQGTLRLPRSNPGTVPKRDQRRCRDLPQPARRKTHYALGGARRRRLHAQERPRDQGLPACPATLLRHASSRRRCRSARHPRVAGTLLAVDDPKVHPRRPRAIDGGLRQGSSARVIRALGSCSSPKSPKRGKS